MTRGSGFYNAQERNSTGGGATVGGSPWCSARVVTNTLPGLVRSHEERHAEVYRETYGSTIRGVLPELERMTGSYGELADRYDPLRQDAHEAAMTASLAIHRLNGNPNKVTPTENGRPCNLKNENRELLSQPPAEAAG